MKYYIYFLIRNKRILYIGQSTNIIGRISYHIADQYFDDIRLIECDESKLKHYETRLIYYFKPPNNVLGNLTHTTRRRDVSRRTEKLKNRIDDFPALREIKKSRRLIKYPERSSILDFYRSIKSKEMSAEKRKVSTDALDTLGTIITDGGRDAIHLAVEPIEAGESLNKGEDLVIIEGKAYAAIHHPDNKPLGIADPFLKNRIQKGEKFWLIVYPRQITSLRHVWSHPDFEESKTTESSNDPIEISKQWIKDFADRIRQHPESLMEAADLWLECEDYTYDNSERYKDHWNEFPEFWNHYEIVTGKKVPDKSDTFFTCSC